MKKLIREGRLEYELEFLLKEVEEWFVCECDDHSGRNWLLAVTRLGTILLACPKCEKTFIHSPS